MESLLESDSASRLVLKSLKSRYPSLSSFCCRRNDGTNAAPPHLRMHGHPDYSLTGSTSAVRPSSLISCSADAPRVITNIRSYQLDRGTITGSKTGQTSKCSAICRSLPGTSVDRPNPSYAPAEVLSSDLTGPLLASREGARSSSHRRTSSPAPGCRAGRSESVCHGCSCRN
jgi:hypothetical protein